MCATKKPWTPLDKAPGCTCPRGPLFHIVICEGRKRNKIPVGRNEAIARTELAKIVAQQEVERQRRLDKRLGRKRLRATPTVGLAYVTARDLITIVDLLIPGAQPWAKPNLKQALADLYRVEDALTKALKEGGA